VSAHVAGRPFGLQAALLVLPMVPIAVTTTGNTGLFWNKLALVLIRPPQLGVVGFQHTNGFPAALHRLSKEDFCRALR
jgi:hypothetical protein